VFDSSLQQLVQEMYDVMIKNNGVGLAAPQVGVSLQIALALLNNKTTPFVLINPKIISSSGKIKEVEGCLSSPKINVSMKRFQKVQVESRNLKGGLDVWEFTDFDARIVQHEIDHLYGKLIVDKLK
jgi:peptide deformylase